MKNAADTGTPSGRQSPAYSQSIEITTASELNRRQLMGLTAGLLLAFTIKDSGRAALAAGGPGVVAVNAFVGIGTDESITIYIGGGEMGQGIYSGLGQGVAEELMVDWTKVSVKPVDASHSWLTGGSSGISRHLIAMRQAGAVARDMLVQAAANTWGISTSLCKPVNGSVVNQVSGATLSYGKLAAAAAVLPVPAYGASGPTLTPDSQLRIIGKAVARPDIPSKTDGSAIYGIDVVLPNMVFAAVKHCPTLGGTVSGTITKPSGAIAVVNLGNAVAAVGTNTQQAFQLVNSVKVNWSIPASSKLIDSSLYATQQKSLLANGNPFTVQELGNVAAAFTAPKKVVDATYSLPYLPHACMEVLNCTVNLTSTTCDIYAPTQAPNLVLAQAISLTGLTAANIRIYPTMMGGGLGRKFELDYVTQAIKVAQAVKKPVKLTWSREQDMGNDRYRPSALIRIQCALDSTGNLIGWKNRIVSPSILFQRGAPGTSSDSQATEGSTDLPYGFGSRLIEYVRDPAAAPVGFWRSVGFGLNTFAVESAIDEAALAAGVDPLVYRQRLLAGNTRWLNVLNAAAALGNWSTKPPAGRARGIAICQAFGTIVAQVAEISATSPTNIRVYKVACAVDCGNAVNPNSVEAQMQGGILHGLSAAMFGQVKFAAGVPSVRNFSNSRVLRMREAPVITVSIINSGFPITGTGEPGVPPIAPAVANAYAKLTGTRLRSLPFYPNATMSDD